jgi:hypothetical protein
MRWLRDLFRSRVNGHVCEVRSMMVTLRALCEYVGNEVPHRASVSQCQVAIMEAHDEQRAKIEAYEGLVRRALSRRLGVDLPADAEITPEVAEAALCQWRDPGRVLG